ncbi:hypothetical protein H2198_008846 [Neophaeococcomyces mojaviensis]|uniref:Uncharacterized protein n=1 Tax=Neophaeococcomyces mojaviensis TaxID=3383035 RepID=A0ACC2ZW42_9EURO|nr:hypothetical protein H2198_008846 [Knufia sp. JES_112]
MTGGAAVLIGHRIIASLPETSTESLTVFESLSSDETQLRSSVPLSTTNHSRPDTILQSQYLHDTVIQDVIVELVGEDLEPRDLNGMTALELATANGLDRVVESLLKRRTQVDLVQRLGINTSILECPTASLPSISVPRIIVSGTNVLCLGFFIQIIDDSPNSISKRPWANFRPWADRRRRILDLFAAAGVAKTLVFGGSKSLNNNTIPHRPHYQSSLSDQIERNSRCQVNPETPSDQAQREQHSFQNSFSPSEHGYLPRLQSTPGRDAFHRAQTDSTMSNNSYDRNEDSYIHMEATGMGYEPFHYFGECDIKDKCSVWFRDNDTFSNRFMVRYNYPNDYSVGSLIGDANLTVGDTTLKGDGSVSILRGNFWATEADSIESLFMKPEEWF